MDEAMVRTAAYAMPFHNPSYPPGPYRFKDRLNAFIEPTPVAG